MTFALCFGQVANICTPTQADSSQRNPVPIEPMETFCKWVSDVHVHMFYLSCFLVPLKKIAVHFSKTIPERVMGISFFLITLITFFLLKSPQKCKKSVNK